MGKSRRSGWRGGIGAIAVLAIASGVVFAMATAAGAEPVSDVQGLKESCSKGTGKYEEGNTSEGFTGICTVKGGFVVCTDKQDGSSRCTGFRDRKGRLDPTDVVAGTIGVKMTTQTVPDSHVWKQKLSIPALTDVVCPSIRGDVVARSDSTIGVCVAPTATIVCKDGLSDTNCVGIAETKKQADSLPKQIKTAVRDAGSTPTTPTTAPTSPTTSPNAPPTTKKCRIRGGCTPTVPPSKVPSSSVPVGPPKGGNRGLEPSS